MSEIKEDKRAIAGQAMIDELATQTALLGDDDDIRAILGEVCDVSHMGFAAVARVTDTRWIACQVIDRIELGLTPGDELKLKTTICDEIRQHGAEVVIDHVSADPRWRTHHTPMMYGFESYVSLPVVLADGRFFGTLCAIDPGPRDLTAKAVVEALRSYAQRLGSILSSKASAVA